MKHHQCQCFLHDVPPHTHFDGLAGEGAGAFQQLHGHNHHPCRSHHRGPLLQGCLFPPQFDSRQRTLQSNSPLSSGQHESKGGHLRCLLPMKHTDNMIQVWDLIILIPNLTFLLFLFYKLPATRLKLRATNSELFRSLYSIVLTCSLASALRYMPEPRTNKNQSACFF